MVAIFVLIVIPGPLNEDDSRQLKGQTQRKLTFENRWGSDDLRTFGKLDNDLREDICSINDKLEVFEKKIEKYETVENLKLHNKALEDRVL